MPNFSISIYQDTKKIQKKEVTNNFSHKHNDEEGKVLHIIIQALNYLIVESTIL